MSNFVAGFTRHLHFAPDGSALAYTCNEGVNVWHIRERRLETRFPAANETNIAISDDCRWVVRRDCKPEGSVTTVYDFETALEKGTFEGEIHVYHFPVHVSADGLRLSAIVCRDNAQKSKTAVIMNLETGATESAFSIDRDTSDIVWSHTSKLLVATNTTDDIIQIWDTTTGTLRCTAGRQNEMHCVAISPDERVVATGGEGSKGDKRAGQIVVCDAATGRELTRFFDESSWGVTALAFTPDGKLVYGNGDGFVIIRKIPERVLAVVTP